jgi:hypothetical protein
MTMPATATKRRKPARTGKVRKPRKSPSFEEALEDSFRRNEEALRRLAKL